MNKKVLVLVVLTAALIAYLTLKKDSGPLDSSEPKKKSVQSHKEIQEPKLKSKSKEEIKKIITENKEKIEKIEKDSNLPRHRKSLAKVARLMAAPVREDVDHEGFINLLKETGLEPIVRDRNNEDLGRIIHIRTKNSLPGTRYLQARFQNTPDGQTVAAYLTMDYRPGEKSLEEAHSEMTKWFGLKETPDVVKDGYRLTKTNDCHHVWTKKMKCDDLKNHQFNAYDCKTDEGTIQVMWEEDIHCGMNDDHNHDAENFNPTPEPDPIY